MWTHKCIFGKNKGETYGRSQQILRSNGKGGARCPSESSGSKETFGDPELDTVQEAVDAVGISRSSFYKYKDDIFPFKEKTKGENITFILQMDDETGTALSGAGGYRSVSREHPDDPSEYSYERRGRSYVERGDPAHRRRCRGNGG